MAIKLWEAPTVNNWRTTIADSINDSVTSFGLVSTVSLNPSQLVVPGVLVIDRIDASDGATPSKREYVSFSSISGATIYSVVRGIGGSTGQSHGAGSRIEAIPSITHWEDLIDFLQVEHLSTGAHDVFSHVRSFGFTGISGASGLRGDVVLIPGANISVIAVSGASGYSYVQLAGASVAGVGGLSPFTISGLVPSGTNLTPPLLVEDSLTIKSVSAALLSPVSSASLLLDINKNFTSIFTDQNTRLSILGSGTYASTASVGTTTLTPGNILTLDVDNPGGTTLTVLLET